MKPISDDEFELSTGKRLYAHRLMLSIGRDGDGLDIGYGADGDIHLKTYWPEEKDRFTPDEQREIALYAIAMWEEFLEAIPK